ncbi:uncharacterized protein LOC128395930 [Panonychus citri]|uniref:uncharacterized protein LOC128395930 n=1 Tax=Panonychus citri TaxID=50023 RepID=UPI00230723C5|nr:uncharacterized protein LOC128395930 [Panonychus citri]
MDLAIVCLLIIFFFTLNGECFKKFSFFGSKGSPPPPPSDSQCTCTCRPQVQTRYVAIEVPKMIPAPSPPPPPPPPPPPAPVSHSPKKTHIISIQEVEIPIVKHESNSWGSPTPPPSWSDRRWDEETNYQSTDSYDYNDNNKMSNYGDDGDLGSLMKDDQIK